MLGVIPFPEVAEPGGMPETNIGDERPIEPEEGRDGGGIPDPGPVLTPPGADIM